MKNKYVIIGMIIIIAVVTVLGVYEIINSIGFNREMGKAISNEKSSVDRLLEETNDIEIKKVRMNYAIEQNQITENKILKEKP